MKDAL